MHLKPPIISAPVWFIVNFTEHYCWYFSDKNVIELIGLYLETCPIAICVIESMSQNNIIFYLNDAHKSVINCSLTFSTVCTVQTISLFLFNTNNLVVKDK